MPRVAEEVGGLGFSAAGSLQFLEGSLVLFELLASLTEFSLRRQALVLLEFLDRLIDELLRGRSWPGFRGCRRGCRPGGAFGGLVLRLLSLLWRRGWAG